MLGSGVVIRVYQRCRNEYREEHGNRDGKALAPSSSVNHRVNLSFYAGVCCLSSHVLPERALRWH
jgi:hypothetical protein